MRQANLRDPGRALSCGHSKPNMSGRGGRKRRGDAESVSTHGTAGLSRMRLGAEHHEDQELSLTDHVWDYVQSHLQVDYVEEDLFTGLVDAQVPFKIRKDVLSALGDVVKALRDKEETRDCAFVRSYDEVGLIHMRGRSFAYQ